ncbi:MAG: transposase [Deltaproteobacteria bacterium]|nr:MAG: transposase [Deltaproteobacteria bacterium]
MSRPLRIEYPGAWYHVMNRGRRSEEIFSDREDYYTFIRLIQECIEIWNIKVGAYCLMPNQYHLLIQTPNANIARCMRHLNGVYTQRFNRSHHCEGQLFRGRYKSILVDASFYLLHLVKYIHKRPLKLGLVDKLDAYDWSSHKGYLSDSKKWDWLYKDGILSMLTRNRRQWQKAYREFILGEDSEEVDRLLERKKMPFLLGSESFVRWVKDRFFQQKLHREVPESKTLAPDIERIREVVAKAYRVNKEDLTRSKRGVFNEPRNVAIYLVRTLRGANLDEICREFHLSRHSSASSVIERTKNQIKVDRKLRRRVERIRSRVIRSARKT